MTACVRLKVLLLITAKLNTFIFYVILSDMWSIDLYRVDVNFVSRYFRYRRFNK